MEGRYKIKEERIFKTGVIQAATGGSGWSKQHLCLRNNSKAKVKKTGKTQSGFNTDGFCQASLVNIFFWDIMGGYFRQKPIFVFCETA